MTTKEIAKATGKDETAVRRWARKVASGSPVVAAKIADSTAYHPADYSLDETCAIIEVGLGKNAADLFRMSASQNDPKPRPNDEVITRADLAVFGASIVSEVMKQFLPLIQNQPKQIEFVQDYYSIKGYASKLGHQITFSEALALGRLAGKLSRETGREIRKVDDEAFGQVNSYYIAILKEVFQI